MSAIDIEKTRRVANLARIVLTEDEIAKIAVDLGVISDVVAKISEVTTPDVPATSHPILLTSVWREDVVGPTLDHDETLAQAPHPKVSTLGVPQTLREE